MASEEHETRIRLEHFREPFRARLVDLDPWEKNQLALMLSQEADTLATMFDSPPNEEGGAYGVVDVIDEATDELGKAFMSDLAAAWREGARRMRMWAGHIDFALSIADDE